MLSLRYDVDDDPAVTYENSSKDALHRFAQAAYPKNTYYTARPTGLWSVVRPNVYEPSKGYVAVYNWDNLDKAEVDLSGVSGLQAGDRYEVIDAQNPLGPAVTGGVYQGGAISLPLNCTAAAKVDGAPSAFALPYVHTKKEFNCFIVRCAEMPK